MAAPRICIATLARASMRCCLGRSFHELWEEEEEGDNAGLEDEEDMRRAPLLEEEGTPWEEEGTLSWRRRVRRVGGDGRGG